MSWLHRISLRTILFVSFTAVLLLTIGVSFVSVSNTVDAKLQSNLDKRGRMLARLLAERGPRAVTEESLAGPSVDAIASQTAGEGHALLLRANLEAFKTSGVGPTLTARVRDAFRGAGLRELERVEVGEDEAGRRLYLWAAAIKEGESTVGWAAVLLSDRDLAEARGEVRGTLGVVFVGGMVVFLALLFVISRFFIMRPLEEMMGVAKKISDCDLTEQSKPLVTDEFGQLGHALNRTAENLRATLSKVKGVSEGVASVIEQIGQTGDAVAAGASTTAQSVSETSSSMEEMIASLKGIAENVEVLAQSAEESSNSIQEMAATNDEVAENIQGLSASVEETTSAIEQMTFSIKQVAKNIEELSATAEETSSSMNEMDVSIGQVETNANETAKLSELVSQDADTGVKAIQKTIVGIDKIKESSRQAADVIESLGRKISTIGNILNVIDDVAEQTNLLALNAAIIAAQAGEHGKGFAVVADEIKDLAERTGASTKEISQLIQNVQDESKNAIGAMERGVKSVEEGVRLGGEAEGALKKINESAGKSTQMIKAIARATVEQARGSKQVTNAINRIAETVQQIARATAEQARGSEQIIKSSEKMKAITKVVERSSQEQARGSKQITRSIESINEMVSHLNRAQKEQTKGSESVMKAVESIKGVADQQNHSMTQLEQAIDLLAKQAEVLREEVKRFRV